MYFFFSLSLSFLFLSLSRGKKGKILGKEEARPHLYEMWFGTGKKTQKRNDFGVVPPTFPFP